MRFEYQGHFLQPDTETAQYLKDHYKPGQKIELHVFKEQRTTKQNSAIWKWFRLCADFLNNCGQDQRVFVDDSIPISWTPEAFKAQVWDKIQIALYDIASSSKLDTQQVNGVYTEIHKYVSENKGITLPEFPHKEPE
jgi:hypothetical protein